jgi:epoxyqueuosine reductase
VFTKRKCILNRTERIREKAYDLGFDLIGVAPAGRAPHADAYAAWVDAGYAAAMGYMVRDGARRQDPRQVLPGARSVVVVGLSYFVAEPPADLWDDPARGRIARYAWGLDYHDVMTPRLRQLADFIAGEAGRETSCRVYVDTGPVLERDMAARAGLGFIGRNTCLISPALGSYLFLGEILTDLDLEFDSAPPSPQPPLSQREAALWAALPSPSEGEGATAPSPLRGEGRVRGGRGIRSGTCGACTRCLVACPTHAFPAPYVLDSNRCISYLTIELKGSIPPDLRPLMGNWIFGCDVCQAVCPWPRRFARLAQKVRADFKSAPTFDPDRVAPKLLDLIALTGDGFRARFAGSPILRAKRRGLLRNVAVALGNWGDAQAIPFLRRALDDPEPLVREHAAWALDRIG